uniref:Gustatory receptor n=1 Tax=Octopus bimaculoides TaxID=37653 RepID=A0A0L8FL56_OCTBM
MFVPLLLGWIIFAFVVLQIFPQLNLCWLVVEHLIIEFGILKEKYREVLNAESSKQFSNEWMQRNEMIMYYCTKHAEMCSLLDETDKPLQHNTSSLILNMILGLCTLFYGFVNDFLENIELLFVCVLPIILSLIAGWVLYRGMKLHQNIHDIVEDLYAMNFKGLSTETRMKLTLFLDRLNTTPSGISVGGFFVIKPSSVLTIFGSLFTYVIVVLQTKRPADSSSS